jgi:ATP-dependent DNA ligase
LQRPFHRFGRSRRTSTANYAVFARVARHHSARSKPHLTPVNPAIWSSSFFDLLYLDGGIISSAALIDRKGHLRQLLASVPPPLQYSDHQIGRGREFYARACEMSVEGIVSKRTDAPYTPGNRGLWLKTKCVNREEFVVVGWTDPAGSSGLLLAYYTPDG